MAASRDRIHVCPVAGCNHRATLQPLFSHLRATHEAEEIPHVWVRQQCDSSERNRRVGSCRHCGMPYISCSQHERTCPENPRAPPLNLESVSSDDSPDREGDGDGGDSDEGADGDADVPEVEADTRDEAEIAAQRFSDLLSDEDETWLEQVMTEEVEIEGVDEGHLITRMLVYSGSTVKRLHKNCRAEYAFVDNMCLQHWVATRDVNALRTWWLLPKLLLRTTEKGGAAGAVEIRSRCQRFLLGGIRQLNYEADDATAAVEPPSGSPNSDSARTRAATELVRQGQLSRAMGRLLSEGIADVSAGTDLRAKLEAKYPAHEVEDLTVEGGEAQDVIVDEEGTACVVRLMAKAKAPDLSGRRNEHVQAVVAETGTTVLAEAISILQNQELTLEEKQLLAPTAGTPLNKESASGPDVRPIGSPSKLRLTATAYNNILHMTAAGAKKKKVPADLLCDPFASFFLEHRQFGVGVQGGLETVIHSIQLLSQQFPERLWIKLDVINAFNTAKRTSSFAVLKRRFPATIKLLRNFYGEQWITVFNARKADELFSLLVSTGSSQGDVYGGLMFCAAYSEVLQATIKKFPGKVEIFSYHDDTYVQVDSRHANTVVGFMEREAKKHNIVYSLGKSAIWRPSLQQIPASVLPAIIKRNVEGLEVLGTPIGTHEFCKAFMNGVVEKYDELHQRLRGMDDPQSQYLLLRYCCCNNLNHWLRTVSPEDVQEAAERFDVKSHDTITTMLSPQNQMFVLPDRAELQARLIVKKGGLGLVSASRTADPAWLGSWSLTKKLLKSVLQNHPAIVSRLDNFSGDISADHTTARSVSAAYDRVAALARECACPLPAKDKLEEIPEKAQKRFNHSVIAQLDSQLTDEVEKWGDDADKARLHSVRGYGACAWLQALPTVSWGRFIPSLFRILLRSTLGLEQALTFGGCQCACGQVVDGRAYHYLCCRRGGHRITTHNSVVRHIHSMTRACNYMSRIQDLTPLFRTATGRHVPDQVIFDWSDDGTHMATDTSVTCPAAPSFVAEAARGRLSWSQVRG